MQVTQIDDRITHAVAGGAKVQSFGIAQTAEFFQVLSSSLYSNKKLAVVRETLCNAWDAHIEGGVTDTPIKVTLDDKKLIIQDFGPGIHADDMPHHYCTYGGTTKVTNENVTGGFGLGCKSPFAYTDHFEVTSCHEGVKTVYRLSLSSAMVGGLPSMTEIVSVPTKETGLTVSIDIETSSDRRDFDALVRQIASFGAMNLELNRQKVKTIPFDKAPHGFLIVQGKLIQNNESLLCVRYGNVVYPMGRHEDYDQLYNKAVNVVSKLSKDRYGWGNGVQWTTVLQAQPNTISVTPSRESISMTEHTVTTLKKLLTEFLSFMHGLDYKEKLRQLGRDRIEECGLTYAPKDLFDIGSMPRSEHDLKVNENTKYIATADDLAMYNFRRQYPDLKNFKKEDLELRIKKLMQMGFNNRNCAHSLLADVRRRSDGDIRWYHQKYLWPIIRNAGKKINISRLMFYSEGRLTDQHGFCEAIKVKIRDKRYGTSMTHEQVIGLLRDIVVIAHTKDDIQRAYELSVFKNWIGPLKKGCLFYRVARSPRKIETARKYFTDLGMNVLDLTVPLPDEDPVVIEPVKKEVPLTTRKKGIPKLSACVKGERFSLHQTYEPNTDRIENPEFYIEMSPRRDDHDSTDRWGTRAMVAIIRLFGDKGGVTRNVDHSATYANKGALPFTEWILPKLLEEFTNNSKIKTYFEYSTEHHVKSIVDFDKQIYLDTILKDDELRKKFKIPLSFDLRERDYAAIYRSIPSYLFRNHAVAKQIKALVDTWEVHPNLHSLCELLNNDDLIKILDGVYVGSVLRGSSVTAASIECKKKVRKIILSLLKD